MDKKTVGSIGEIEAAKFLKKNKYKILDTNYTTKFGEVDIICTNKDYIVFVEVKTRNKDTLVEGVFAVNKIKQTHILRTANSYLLSNKINKQPRFDIIEVERCDGCYKVVNHYIDAFMQGGNYAVF